MTSKKTAESKRTRPPRASDYARSFLKDWERLSRSGRYDMNRLKQAMLPLIVNDAPLGPEWRDHALGGDWDGHRECHVGGDFLLAYRIDDSGRTGMVVFVCAGTHADLFEWRVFLPPLGATTRPHNPSDAHTIPIPPPNLPNGNFMRAS